jgi:phage-related protein
LRKGDRLDGILVQRPDRDARRGQDSIGCALDLAQHGGRAAYASPMHGALRDVIEIRAKNGAGDGIFRAVYTAKLGDDIYVLDAFQKKSTSGIKTPQIDLDRIRERLKQGRKHHEEEQRAKA